MKNLQKLMRLTPLHQVTNRGMGLYTARWVLAEGHNNVTVTWCDSLSYEYLHIQADRPVSRTMVTLLRERFWWLDEQNEVQELTNPVKTSEVLLWRLRQQPLHRENQPALECNTDICIDRARAGDTSHPP